MPKISITADTSRVSAFLRAVPRDASRALVRSLTRGTTAMGTQAKRVVARDTGMKQRDVAKRIKVKKPTGSLLTGEVRGSLTRVPIIELGAKGPEPSRGKGRLTYKIGRSRKAIPGAFITRVGGHRGAFKRKTGRRLPIYELHGPSVGRVMAEREPEIVARGQEVYLKELERQLDRILARLNR